MQVSGWHWMTLVIAIVAAYYVGRHYPLNIPVLG